MHTNHSNRICHFRRPHRGVCTLAWLLLACVGMTGAGLAKEMQMLVVMNGSGKVQRYDQAGKHLGTLVRATANPNAIGVGPDGRLYVGSGEIGWPGVVSRFDLKSGRSLGPFIAAEPGQPGSLLRAVGLAWHDKSIYVVGCDSGQIQQFDAATGKYQREAAKGPPGGFTQLAIRDGKMHVADFKAQGIKRYDLATGRDEGFTVKQDGFHPWGIVFDGQGRLYWSGSTNEIRVFDGKADSVFATGSPLATPIHLQIGPDGHLYVANAGSNTIAVYDTQSRKLLRTLAGPEMVGPIGMVWVDASNYRSAADSEPVPNQKPEEIAFFREKVEPILKIKCYECHSHENKIKGGLALDSRSGWLKGGDNGPAIVANKPEESLLMTAVRYQDDSLQMPPKAKLDEAEIAILAGWIKRGAADPRVGPSGKSWEQTYQARLDWWSLKPLRNSRPPQLKNTDWPNNEIDRFVLARLEAKNLKPAPTADRRTLARRLSFALTGLPPDLKLIEKYLADKAPNAYEKLVDQLLASPHFGEKWARHWMDVVHYSDTHGYEWDAPAKNGWMYRDYLTRAFNRDISFKQLIMEQLAGDLIEPRLDLKSGLNESILGPMSMRLGERRHGDNSAIEGVTQEAVTNMIDTTSKAYLATTVACAQCHDHKLDAVAQQDYYALAGVLMSSRWGARPADAVDPNIRTIEKLRGIKQQLRSELARTWSGSRADIIAKLKAIKPVEKAVAFPESLTALLQRPESKPITPAEFQQQRQRRVQENKTHLKLLADFTRPGGENGWRAEGFGMKHGLARDGDFVVADEGNAALLHLLPAGRWSHLWSQRLAGAVRSPLFDQGPPATLSVGYAAGRKVGQSFNIDHAFHSERMAFPEKPMPGGWLTLTAGNFDRLSGPADQLPRRVFLEFVTKSLNNYFPARTGYGGITDADIADPRSWFGISRVYQHPATWVPQDELGRFEPLFGSDSAGLTREKQTERAADLILAAVGRWSQGQSTEQDVKLLNEAVAAGWLANSPKVSPAVERLVNDYRATEKQIQPDQTIGTADDWHEGRNEFIGLRGSYTEFGDEVPRGNIRLLGGPDGSKASRTSGRLEFAQSVASDQNPLTARVFVNRLWLHLFGEGLVRTPDDFGHLGERPEQPELLDALAARFIQDGWSVKKMIRLMVTSATFQQSSRIDPTAAEVDPENRLWHHYPQRRLEAEPLRDSLLAVSGRLDPALGGPPIDPHRTAQDAAKRLFSGPLDGLGRRSIYLKMTMMEPPRFLALFNQPIPKLTTGKRDRTNVPDQALAMLNDPFVLKMAEFWADRVLADDSATASDRARRMFSEALGRPPGPDELRRLEALAARSAELHGTSPGQMMQVKAVWQDMAHAIFNLKEFLYVR